MSEKATRFAVESVAYSLASKATIFSDAIVLNSSHWFMPPEEIAKLLRCEIAKFQKEILPEYDMKFEQLAFSQDFIQ